MSINYKVTRCKNPGKSAVQGVHYFAGRAVKTSDYTFEYLATDINNSTTVTKADALAVLASIKPFITKALLNGQAVVLNDIGRFQISLQGKCYSQDAMAASDFSPSAMITGHKIVFRPDPELKKEVAKEFKLVRISSEAMK